MLEGLKPAKSKGHVCKVATTLEELDATDSEILAAARRLALATDG